MTEAMQILVGLLADARNKLTKADFGSYCELRGLLDQSLDKLERALHRRPTVVVAGEANSGKTSVANMLAGLNLLPAAVVANTSVPVLLRQGIVPTAAAVTTNGRVPLSTLTIDEPLPKFLMGGLKRIEVELPGMRDAGFAVLDTPAWPVEGLASETADIFVWCSVAARSWAESERRAMIELPARLRDRSLLVITNKDALAPAECARVLSRYRELAGLHFTDMVMIDAASEPPDEEEENSAQMSKSDHAALLDALAQLIDDYWNHRAMTGRRLCRHIARSLRLGIPASQGGNGTTASDPDPVSAILINIAGRLATV